MDRREVIDRLGSLMKLEHDAVLAYEMAAKSVRGREAQELVRRFRQSHERHVGDLESAIRREGGEPPELSRDVRGVFLEGMSAVGGGPGEAAIFRASETGEKYVSYKYGQAAKEDFPPNAMALIERHSADERHHLSYLEKRLEAARAGLGRGRTIGLLALGVAAGAVIGRRVISR